MVERIDPSAAQRAAVFAQGGSGNEGATGQQDESKEESETASVEVATQDQDPLK